MEDSRFLWVEFYMELAGKLLPYKEDHAALVDKCLRPCRDNVCYRLSDW